MKRARRAFVAGLMTIGTVVALQVVVATSAFANAADPDPTTSGTATVNADGTVTAKLHGTWSWPGQNCAGRYGEGWAVDWWGISSSATPNPSFSLTDATQVTGPGQTTTGTISPAGAIPIPGGTYFHVAQYYAGEAVNSPTTCSDTANGSAGTWSAQATYPSLSDIPDKVCVNMYDEHGKEGKPSTNSTDYSPSKDKDNSIQTNHFDPSMGNGYCVHLQVQETQKIAGHIYACSGGATTTNEVTGGTLAVTSGPTTIPAQPNPLAPTSVPAGTYTMAATAPAGYQFVACGTGSSSSTKNVTVPSGGLGVGKFYVAKTSSPQGYLEICKQQSGSGLAHQVFSFKVQGKTVDVPVGACSPALKVTAGNVSITEVARAGAKLVSVSTIPSNRLVSVSLSTRTAVVKVPAGDISKQTVATFTNKKVPGNGYLKVCKVAGSGVAVGTEFKFTVGGKTMSVPAGPAPGGYCVVFGQYPFGDVTVTEAPTTGYKVSSITTAPSGRMVSANTSTGTATVSIGSGVTEVTYTNKSS